MELLRNGKAWIVWSFADGSKRTFLTTLSPAVMAEERVPLKDGFLYDLEHHCYEEMRDDVTEVEIFSEKPQYEEEVLKFASRFI